MTMRARTIVSALLVPAIGIVAGCALAPPPATDEVRAQAMPNVALPSRFVAPGGTQGAVRANWLATFHEPQLDSLVREALGYNVDLRIAAARVEQAAAYAKLANSTIYPVVNLLAHGGGKSGGDASGLNIFGLFASWELDVWGRVRAQKAAGEAQYASASLDAEYARQSIAAMVAKSWILAIEARAQRAIADDIVRASEQSVGLAGDRLRVGRGDEYDVALARANFDTSRDAARQLALAYEQAQRALELLIGRYPAAALDVPAMLPPLPGPVPVGLPSDLLERRPDVIAAARRIDTAFYNVLEARAARLPKIALTASVNTVSSELFLLQNHSNPVASLGANLIAPLFNGHALESQVDIRTAEQKLAIADYGRVATKAFADVETALSSEFTATERQAFLASSVTNNGRTVELAQVRYRVGSGDLRAVLTQNVALYGARTALLRAQSEALVQRVNLYLALGGGFDEPPAQGSAAVGRELHSADASPHDADRASTSHR
jgi:NodT family efflux transporter outer membrane factor (OMF) lipoprotein